MIKGGGFLVKDSVAAVESLASAWAKDIEKGGHKKHSSFIQKLCEYYIERNFPSKDIAQFVTGSAVAVLGNTLPTAFWFVAHLYSDRKVFEACREEILAQVVHGKDESGNPVRTVDITALKVACPLLHSAFKEVLRLEAVGTGARGVEEDHMLDGKYLLRKDALVLMPLVSQHFDHERWGADAEEYCYDRFTDKTRPRVSNVSFRSFGGGTTLCPGRHFVTTELLAFAAMLLLRFDIVPKDGKWVIPTSFNAEMTTNMPAPDFDLDVEIRRRSDDEGLKWVWRLSESEHAAMLADQDEHGNDKA
jgi:cytochrome P450